MSIVNRLLLEQVLLDGSKEMVFIMRVADNHSFIYDFIENLQEAMKAPWKINKNILSVTSSIGVAIAYGTLQ